MECHSSLQSKLIEIAICILWPYVTENERNRIWRRRTEKQGDMTVYLPRLSMCPRVVMLTGVYIHRCTHNLIWREINRSLVWIHWPCMGIEKCHFTVQYVGNTDRRTFLCCSAMLQYIFCKTRLFISVFRHFYQFNVRKYKGQGSPEAGSARFIKSTR